MALRLPGPSGLRILCWLTLVLIISAILAWAQNPAPRGGRGSASPAPSAVSGLLHTLKEETSPGRAVRDVSTIWETDRWFTFPKFEQTARNVAAIMRRAGLEEVEIGTPPADGVTQGGFWTMPLAWDVKVGVLEIVEPPVPDDMRVLADYQKVPTSLCMWSGPTPPGGVVTEVALASGNLENLDLNGKLVLGQAGSKTALAKAGVLGLISENTENRDLVDERGWVNSFGDNGWSFTKGSTPLVCFSITPRGSQLLRDLLKKGPVKVRAQVDSRYKIDMPSPRCQLREVTSLNGHRPNAMSRYNCAGFSVVRRGQFFLDAQPQVTGGSGASASCTHMSPSLPRGGHLGLTADRSLQAVHRGA